MGRAIALALAADGAAVAVAGRTEQVWDDRLPGTIGETVADIEAAGGRAVAVRADLTDRTTSAVVGAARDAGPHHNSGQQRGLHRAWPTAGTRRASRAPSPPSAELPRRQTRLAGLRQYAVAGLSAALRHRGFCRLRADAIGVPRHDRGGRWLDHQHHLGRVAVPGDGPYPDRSGGVLPGYGGSKAALEHLTQCAAFDLADHNIAVNALSPSKAILTPGLATMRANSLIPPRRMNSPGQQLNWRWRIRAWSPGARSAIGRFSTAASGHSRLARRGAVAVTALMITAWYILCATAASGIPPAAAGDPRGAWCQPCPSGWHADDRWRKPTPRIGRQVRGDRRAVALDAHSARPVRWSDQWSKDVVSDHRYRKAWSGYSSLSATPRVKINRSSSARLCATVIIS